MFYVLLFVDNDNKQGKIMINVFLSLDNKP